MAAKDLTKFVKILNGFSFENIVPIIKSINEQIYRTKILNNLSEIQPSLYDNISLPEKEMREHIECLCKYFPEKVYDLKKYFRPVDHFFDVCLKYQVYDVCAEIKLSKGSFSESFDNIKSFYEKNLLLFVSEKIDEKVYRRNHQFSLTFLAKLIKQMSKFEYQSLSKIYLTPFLILKKSYSESMNQIKFLLNTSLVECCYILKEFVPFSTLIQSIIHDYSIIPFGLIKTCLSDLIRNYNYDTSIVGSLADALKDDAIKLDTIFIDKIFSKVPRLEEVPNKFHISQKGVHTTETVLQLRRFDQSFSKKKVGGATAEVKGMIEVRVVEVIPPIKGVF